MLALQACIPPNFVCRPDPVREMKKRGEPFVVLAVLIANASGVVIALVVPALLSTDQYATFALTWAVGQFLAMLCFEWLRFPVLRFSAGPDPVLAGERGALMAAVYWRMAAAILAAALTTAIFVRASGPASGLASGLASGPASGPASGIAAIVPIALVFAASQGSFDGRQAFARAARDNFLFARNWSTRALLSIFMVSAAAWLTRSGSAAVLALSVSFPLALAMGANGRIRAGGPPLRWPELPRLARYGALAAVSGVVAYSLPTLVRWALVAKLGKDVAAGALLAADLSQKALWITGAAVNVVMMQNSFSAIDTGKDAVIADSARRQLAWTFAVVMPIGLVLWLLGDDIAKVLMKPAYSVAFAAAIGPCALAGGLLCVRLFAIDPLFYAFEKPGFSVAGAAASLGAFVLGPYLAAHAGITGIDPLTAFWMSGALGLAVSATLAIGVLGIRPPWSQLARIALAAGLTGLISLAMPALSGLLGLIVRGAVLGLTYGAAALLLDIVWLRSEVLPRLIGRDFLRNKA